MIDIPSPKYSILKKKEQQEQIVEKKTCKINLCAIEALKNASLIDMFPLFEYQEIQEAIYGTISLQNLIKHIHYKFNDSGLISTLIYQIYQADSHEIEFYVPQLVYMAVINKSKELKKVLIKKSEEFESLHRLILWNLKAMTVLMINRDREIREYVENFENQIIKILKTEEDLKDFKNSEKAIAMLTTASLVLKKKNKEEQLKHLKNFIRKFNEAYLSTISHKIIIPFRFNSENQVCRSNLVVRIIEDNCSCFPTRKRVPYRIILETIDTKELRGKIDKKNDRRFNANIEKIQDDSMFQEVLKQVEDSFNKNKQSDSLNNTYPFVVDLSVEKQMQDLNNYAKKVENDEKEQQKLLKSKWKLKKLESLSLIASKLFPKKDQKGQDNVQLENDNGTSRLKPSKSQSELDYRKAIRAHYRNHGKRFTFVQSDDEEQSEVGDDSSLKKRKEKIWGKSWTSEMKKLRNSSRFKNEFKSLRYHNVVIKGGDDLRQEIICMQLIYKIKSILKEADLDIVIKPYEIIVLSENSGLLEFVSNSISIDGIKKLVFDGETITNLYLFFLEVFDTKEKLQEAKIKFMKSLVGSSILTYALRLKDRHNGNILIDREGHIIHIDFGFIFGLSPGGINFETSPFKLTTEYVALLDGKDSPLYNDFKDLFCAGMNELRKRFDQICLILDIMMQKSDLECFQNFDIATYKSRFHCHLTDQKFKVFCEGLVEKSCMNSRTVHYDTFQKFQNGIMP